MFSMKNPAFVTQPDCPYCGGLHYGTPRGKCVFQCARCHLDIRDDAVGFGHKKCECAPLPVIEVPKPKCPHNALRKMKTEGLTFNGYICGNCATVFEATEHKELEPPEEPMFDNRPPWGLRDRQA